MSVVVNDKVDSTDLIQGSTSKDSISSVKSSKCENLTFNMNKSKSVTSQSNLAPLTHSWSAKIMCSSDGQGRQVANAVKNKSNLNAFNMTKSKPKFNTVTEDCMNLCSDLDKEDVVFTAGTNNVA